MRLAFAGRGFVGLHVPSHVVKSLGFARAVSAVEHHLWNLWIDEGARNLFADTFAELLTAKVKFGVVRVHLGVDGEILGEKIARVGAEFVHRFDLGLRKQHDLTEISLIRHHRRARGLLGEIFLRQRDEPIRRLLQQIGHVHMRELLAVELRVGLVHAGQVEELHDVGHGHLLAIVAGIPAEQRQVVHQRLGQEIALLVFLDEGAFVALRHLTLTHLG